MIHLRFCDDRELVERWVNGDTRAGDELVRRHRPDVLHFAQYSYHLDPDTAEEVAQITFERLQMSIHGFQGRCAVKTFIRSIANHACLDLRRGRARTRSESDTAITEATDLADDSADPAQHAIISAALERCMEMLTDRTRAVFVARATEGHSYEELAVTFDMTGSAVGRVICEARQALAECLEAEA